MLFASVYILASKRNGTLYTGVTSNLEARIWQHRQETFPGFSQKYGCKTLVWFEMHDDINEAIAREKRIKDWKRAWKIALIQRENPEWVDLFEELLAMPDSSILPEARGLNVQVMGPGFRRDDKVDGLGTDTSVSAISNPPLLVIPAKAGTHEAARDSSGAIK